MEKAGKVEHVSDTALWVATYRAEETRRPDGLFRDPLADRLAGRKGREIAARMPHGAIMQWILTVRTVAIDRLILRALSEGVDCVINLGAGLDTRPYRMELPSRLRWIEVDFPAMIRYKTDTLAGESAVCILERAAVDLGNETERRKFLEQVGKTATKTLILTEGVTPYLTAQEAEALSRDLLAVPSILFWIQDHRSGGLKQIPAKFRRAMKDVPFKLNLDDELGFFVSHGWKVAENIEAQDEALRIGRPFPLPFPWNWVRRIAPGLFTKSLRRMNGYALLTKTK